MGLRIHRVSCSKCDFKQLLRKSCPDTSPDNRYKISGSEFGYPIITSFAWCPNCKDIEKVETLDCSGIHKRLNQLRLQKETYLLKHVGILDRLKVKLGLSDVRLIENEITNANRLLELLSSRTDRKCLRCGFPVPASDFKSGIRHPILECPGGILTESIEETEIHLDFDNSCRSTRWYSPEGVFLGEQKVGM